VQPTPPERTSLEQRQADFKYPAAIQRLSEADLIRIFTRAGAISSIVIRFGAMFDES
jgi:hypothetical protein